jgi:pimeloyl-ACP methyl ester carboxylesterase
MTRSCWLAVLLVATSASAATSREYVIPLREGKLPVAQVNATVSRELHLLNFSSRDELDLRGSGAADTFCALNACLWRGSAIELRDDSAVLRLEELPAESLCRRASRMTRLIAAEKYPLATATQARRWGLSLPQRVDRNRPLVVLVHGLDADRNDCVPMGELLCQNGWQVAYFSYPGDQPIEDSAALLARSMHDLFQRFPGIHVNIVAHSMGGLVARDYLERPEYVGFVDRLIMVAPPNHGSSWAHLRSVLSAQENYYLRRDEPEWRWSWVITEGMGEAGSDLLPGSGFLTDLNARSRRAGVKYTIIAGNSSTVTEVEAALIESLGTCVPTFARTWWGFGYCYRGLHDKAERMRCEAGNSDGVVSLSSAALDGVSDLVVVHADHRALYLPDGKSAPAAWAVVKDRLSR